VLEQDPVPPRRVDPRVDIDLETIALKCLEKEPSRRYESALALADELKRWLQGEPILARRVSLPEKTWKWIKRKPMTAALLATAAVLVLLVAVGLPIVKKREERLQREVEARSIQLKTEAKKTEEAANRADLEKAERAKAELARAAEKTKGDAKELEAIESTVEANLRRTKAILAGEDRGGPAEALRLIKETAALKLPLLQVAARIDDRSGEHGDLFWASVLPRLNGEAMRLLTFRVS
jgi:eukaryotic-like serine/threonine-protein kinase